MIHQNLFEYRNHRYLHVAWVLVLFSVLIYVTQSEIQPANGGTWQGYVLGTIGAVLILLLAALGVRKRRYRSRLGSVEGWVSAHIYLGSTLLVVATLHCALQFGWNVHTLAYVLMVAVIFSGFYGLYAYLVYPRRISVNRSGGNREELFGELYELNQKGMTISRNCDPEVQAAVSSSIERTTLGGGVIQQLSAVDHSRMVKRNVGGSGSTASTTINNRDQQAVVDFVATRIPRGSKKFEAENLQKLLTVLCRRQAVLRRIRKDIRMQGWLQVWLYVHIPLTVALLGALSVHILSVFMYW